jgi:microcystin-dependent protein
VDPFVAEIRVFGFGFPPKGWALCNGQLLPISQNTALFSLLGTTYGGDGKSTFALPNLQGQAPMQPGQGPGLSLHDLGESGGSETTTLLDSEAPGHSHQWMACPQSAQDRTPGGEILARATGGDLYTTDTTQIVQMAPNAMPDRQGGGQPHNNMQPYLTVNFCIALQGVYPSRG